MLSQMIQAAAGLAPAALVLALYAVWAGPLRRPARTGAAARARRGVVSARAAALRLGLPLGVAAGLVLAALRESAVMQGRETVSLWINSLLIAVELLVGASIWVASLRRWPAAPILGAALAALTALACVPGVALGFSAFLAPGEPLASTETLMRVIGLLVGAALAIGTGLAVAKAADGGAAGGTTVASAPTGNLTAGGTAAATAAAPSDHAPSDHALAGNAPASAPAPGRLAGWALAAALVVQLLAQAVTVTGYLQGRRVIDLPTSAFRVLAWALNHQGAALLALLAVAAIPVMAAWRRARAIRPEAGATPASARLAKATSRRRLGLVRAALGSYALLLVSVTAVAAWDAREPQLSPPEPFEVVAGNAVIDLTAVEDGHLHRFAYTASDGTVVRFIVIKKNGVAYGVGLDACEICGDTGYLERAGKIICKLCDVVMNVATIGYRGGCNPIPLEYSVDGGQLLVPVSALEAGAVEFA